MAKYALLFICSLPSVAQFMQRAGLSGVTWHTFRHTFASRLTRKGVDLVTVKELLGHSTVTVTMR